MLATFAAIRNIAARVGDDIVAIARSSAHDACVIFTNFALFAFVIASTASIEAADSHLFCAAIRHAIARYAFAFDTGFAIGTAIVAFSAVIE